VNAPDTAPPDTAGCRPGPTRLDEPFARLVAEHWVALVRTAVLLLRDGSIAEDVVSDAVVACLQRRQHISDLDQLLAYVRKAVVNGARSAQRRQRVALAHRPHPMPDHPGADEGAIARLERDAVVAALKRLPRRRREALVLRYYADLSEKQTAAAMGVSVGAVKGYTSRGLAALEHELGDLA
jgi:RNA polymerase sigma-70 factor (sigma-E family)